MAFESFHMPTGLTAASKMLRFAVPAGIVEKMDVIWQKTFPEKHGQNGRQ